MYKLILYPIAFVVFVLSTVRNKLYDFMTITAFLKKKIVKIKNRFDVQKVPIMLQKELETMAYLNKI